MDQWTEAHGLTHRDDAIWKDQALVVVGDNNLRRGVISLFHDSTTLGHPGITKTTQLIVQYYWWPGLKHHVTKYIKGCATCQMTKTNTNPNRPPLNPITAEPDALPFQTIAMDFIVKLTESSGHDTILMITDHNCTKAAIFLPRRETIDLEGVAQLYATHIFPHYSIPQKIISDRDTWFTSNFSKELSWILGIKQNISTAYHPQTDGQSERMNQSLEQYLRLLCTQDQEQWSQWLPLAQYTRNSWPSSTTKKSPFELLMGYVLQAHQPSRKPTLPTIKDQLDKITELRSAAQEAMHRDQDRIIKDRRHKPYKVDNQVWLEGTNLKLPYEMAKLSPKRYGPFRVTTKISNTSYQLDLPPTWKIHPIFHATLLTLYKETKAHGPNFLELPPDIIEGEPEWEAEKILAERKYRNRRQYLIQWKNYLPAHDSWTNESDIHADELIKQYQDSNQTTNTTRKGRGKTKAYIRATHEAEEIPLPPSEPTTPAFSTPPSTLGRGTPTYTEYNKTN